jgi:penicillin-binding protein 1A
MDSGSDNESASEDGPRRRGRRRIRSAEERQEHKQRRQGSKRRRAEKELRKREKALGGKPERRRFLRRRGGAIPLPADGGDSDKPSRPRLRKLRFAFVILGLSMLAGVSWIFGIMMAVAQDLPSLENRQQYLSSENSVVYDAYNNKLTTLTNNQGRVLLPSEDIAPVMKEAVVAIEDRRFYEHNGVDYQGIARAVWQDLITRSAQQGASTITQQFVKNALAAQDSRTVFQKLRESALAYHLEREWSKDKILTEYLNEIYFGEGATGIEAAAKTYFSYNHPGCGAEEDGAQPCASELLPWEAAMLAGIISSPSAYSPRAFPENAKARRDQVLGNMRDQGYITPEEYTQYSEIPVPDSKDLTPPAENSAAPYFTSWLRQQLVDRYGAGEAFGGGLQVRSSLDLELQNRVQAITQNTLAGIPPTASAVVLDNETGGVLAMVGGSDYQNSPFNLATNGHRQPGSAFKPFTLITALSQGRSTGEVFTSAPQEIPFKVKVPKKNGNGTKVLNDVFRVNNYNDSYLGSASIATGTTYSDNSVYSQLGTQVGVENVAATAHALGIETDLASDFDYSIAGSEFHPYNPAIILGGLQTGVTPLEMAHAYNTIAADGRRLSGTMAASSGGPVGILKVTDGGEAGDPTDGDLVPDQTGASGENELVDKQVIEPTVAQTAKDILSTVVTSGTGKRAQNGEPTWGKTGTTDDNGDAWFCGATPDFTACIWVGYRDTVTPMETEFAGAPVDGGTFPALIFAQIAAAYEEVQALHKADDDEDNNAGGEISTDETAVPPVDTGTVAPVPEESVETPAEPAPEEATPAEPAEPAAPSNGAPAAPSSGGGVSAG